MLSYGPKTRYTARWARRLLQGHLVACEVAGERCLVGVLDGRWRCRTFRGGDVIVASSLFGLAWGLIHAGASCPPRAHGVRFDNNMPATMRAHITRLKGANQGSKEA